jgi:hypothetical protein
MAHPCAWAGIVRETPAALGVRETPAALGVPATPQRPGHWPAGPRAGPR